MASGQKLFEGALKRAITQSNGELLRQAADALLLHAASGVPWALQMLADRLDGKASQSVEVKTVKTLDELSLEELKTRVADLLGGTGQEAESPDQPRGVH